MYTLATPIDCVYIYGKKLMEKMKKIYPITIFLFIMEISMGTRRYSEHPFYHILTGRTMAVKLELGPRSYS